MKILVVGSGGREDALIWKIAQSPRVKEIYAAPGNGGIASKAKLVDIKADDIKGLCDFAKTQRIDLTVVGPEGPLVDGIVDLFRKEGLSIFGADREAARLEGSKVFAKELMKEWGVPTADFKVFNDRDKALSYLKRKGVPVVIKADGLAAGKGVFVCKAEAEAEKAIEEIMVKKVFGDSGRRIIIEECLYGEEASIIVISDGEEILPMASSQDHKRIDDNDKGPNTGGMGAYSPAPVAEGKTFQDTIESVIYPIMRGMKKKGIIYKGALYAGIMFTEKGLRVLEFNVRFGDPETQAILPRLKSDIVDLMEASIDGSLSGKEGQWDERSSACVVLASRGYPGKYKKGEIITGLKETGTLKDVVIFHAGTKLTNGKWLTDGGRVLGVAALGEGIEGAIKKAYEAVEMINFDGMHCRRDIGRRALENLKH